MSEYWIEYDEEQEFGFPSLTAAKRRARVIMNKLRKAGDLAPFVQILDEREKEAWHFDTFSNQWHVDRN